MLHKGILWLGIMVMMLALVSCGASQPQKIKIAISYGAVDENHKLVLNAIKLALMESNGKVGQVEVEVLPLEPYDEVVGALTNEREMRVAQQAVDDPEVVLYFGPASSSMAKVSMPILNKAGITQIALGNSWPGLTKPGYGEGEPGIYYPTGKRHFFRLNASDDVQAVSAARWAQQLGFKRIVTINDGQVYGQGLVGIFALAAHDLGLEIVANEAYDALTVTPQQLDELSARVVQLKPDLVYVGMEVGSRDIGLITKIRALAPHLPLMGGDTFVNNSYLTNVPDPQLIEGIYATDLSVSAYQLETAKPFIDSYRKIYGQDPNGWLVLYYDITKVALRAIEQAKEPTRAGVLESMQNLGEYHGALGQGHFNQDGDFSLKLISGYQIKDGKWEFVQILQ